MTAAELWRPQVATTYSLLPSSDDPGSTSRLHIGKARVITVWDYPQPISLLAESLLKSVISQGP